MFSHTPLNLFALLISASSAHAGTTQVTLNEFFNSSELEFAKKHTDPFDQKNRYLGNDLFDNDKPLDSHSEGADAKFHYSMTELLTRELKSSKIITSDDDPKIYTAKCDYRFSEPIKYPVNIFPIRDDGESVEIWRISDFTPIHQLDECKIDSSSCNALINDIPKYVRCAKDGVFGNHPLEVLATAKFWDDLPGHATVWNAFQGCSKEEVKSAFKASQTTLRWSEDTKESTLTALFDIQNDPVFTEDIRVSLNNCHIKKPAAPSPPPAPAPKPTVRTACFGWNPKTDNVVVILNDQLSKEGVTITVTNPNSTEIYSQFWQNTLEPELTLGHSLTIGRYKIKIQSTATTEPIFLEFLFEHR